MRVPKNIQHIISLVTCVTFFNNLIPKHDLLCCSEYDCIIYGRTLGRESQQLLQALARWPGSCRPMRCCLSLSNVFKYWHMLLARTVRQVRCTIAHMSNTRVTWVTEITKTLQSLSSLSVALPQARSDNVTKLGSSIWEGWVYGLLCGWDVGW